MTHSFEGASFSRCPMKNPRNFAVLAEGPLDEIRKLQAAIELYIAHLEQVGAT